MSFSYGTKIVTDGLVFYVDTANPRSYVSGSTTTNSLIGNEIGNLINGTDFSTDNQGSWNLDGMNDYIQLNTSVTLSHLTYSIWYRPSLTDTSFRTLGQTGAWSTTEFACFFSSNPPGQQLSLVTKSNNTRTDTSLPKIINPNFYNTWHNATFVIEPSTQYVYYNGQFCDSDTRTNNGDITMTKLHIGSWMGYGFFGGKIGPITLYGKALSADEVLQNYNALKGRFGL